MDAIRKKIKRNGRNKITIELPDDFKADNIEVIIQSDEENKSGEVNKESVVDYRQRMREFYSKFNVDLNNFKFNRDELYDDRL
ncbi:MAG: hypothetical protein LH629_14240 [Ignavibacteria bacterium]|nr:hypothetical protein [Ignavibacteria bacterium]